MLSAGIVLTTGVIALEGPCIPAKGHKVGLKTDSIARLKSWTQAKYGKDAIQFECLDLLWTMESHWNHKAIGARTRQGRAVGIVQALPASKMKSAGADYLTNPYTQIKWGLKYIRTRYNNNACWALRHELNRGWY